MLSAQVSLVEAYFNGKETSIMVDTGSTVSIIHYNDPTQDRIFQIKKKRTCSHICQDDGNSAESKNNIELASVKRNMSRDINDEGLQELVPDFDETPAPLLLNAVETQERTLGQSGISRNPWNNLGKRNEMPSIKHSVKHSGEYYNM